MPLENFVGVLEIPLYTEQYVAYFSTRYDSSKEAVDDESLPQANLWILKEDQYVPGGFYSDLHNRNIGKHIYEAGSIATLIQIVDRDGGCTFIPEMHIGLLSDEQKKNIRRFQTTPPAQRKIGMLVKEDFVRERLINGVLETLKLIVPERMMDRSHFLHPIRL